MTGVFLNVLFDVGLRAPAAPGSIFAVYAQTATDSYFGVTIAVFGAAAVSFLVASLLLKTDKAEEADDELVHATAAMEGMKGKKSVASSTLAGPTATGHQGPIHDIVFACDAGMGSSAMGASVLRRKIQEAGYDDVTVVNRAIANLDPHHDLVITHRDLTDRAKQKAPSAYHVSVDNFMGSPRYDEIVELLGSTNGPGADGADLAAEAHGSAAAGVLAEQSVVLEGRARTRDDAITEAGRLLVECGAVDPAYVDAMHERERSVSTHMGNLLAIPHGTNDAKSSIRRTALSFVRYTDPVDWNGNPVKFVVGIAGVQDQHLELLGQIARVFIDPNRVAELEAARSPADVTRVLGVVSEEPSPA
jgi:PTS system mannitol-specific IIC component